MTRVALITCAKLPDLSPDDHPLRDALARRGVEVHAVLWDDPDVPWDAYDAAVVRSTWDYHKRVAEFRAWLDARERAGTRLWNPAPLLRWNIHKSYLQTLSDAGVRIVPTVMLRDSAAVKTVMAQRGWDRAVVKPATSATAFRTHVVTANDVDALEPFHDLLVQPFMDEVLTDGEWSVVFIGGAYSHTVVKRPKAGDFRVQGDWGGSSTLTPPPSGLVEQAAAVLAAVTDPWLYARVDGIVRDGTLFLMELEMTEPTLFLTLHTPAAEMLADATLTRAVKL
jgi:glutathione synthase/RimK-type ligase-like ATP-grasp enzyme